MVGKPFGDASGSCILTFSLWLCNSLQYLLACNNSISTFINFPTQAQIFKKQGHRQWLQAFLSVPPMVIPSVPGSHSTWVNFIVVLILMWTSCVHMNIFWMCVGFLLLSVLAIMFMVNVVWFILELRLQNNSSSLKNCQPSFFQIFFGVFFSNSGASAVCMSCSLTEISITVSFLLHF